MKACPARYQWFGLIASCFMMMLVIASQGFAGNAWNPPVATRAEEKRLRTIGAEFLKLQGLVYLFLGALQEENISEVQKLLLSIASQVDTSTKQCTVLSEKLRVSSDIAEKYNAEVAKFNNKTVAYVAAGAIPQGDPVWPAVVKAGYKPLTDLCGNTVREIQRTLTPVTQAIRQGTTPSSEDVWKLLSTVETGSKRARYFTMIFGP